MRIVRIVILTVLLLSSISIAYPLDYITTAESVSWNGAYSSIADGFEAILYNPAGIYMTQRRFGLNLFGSFGARMYNNTFSSDDIIDTLTILESDNPNITSLINRKLTIMPDFGMDMGYNLRTTLMMTYIRFNNFSLGVSLINKTDGNFTLSKSIFQTVLQNLSLSSPINAIIKFNLISYTDLTISLSTRARFIEKVLPVEAIFVGTGVHIYVPTSYTSFEGTGSFETADPDPDTGLYSYKTNVKGSFITSSNAGFLSLADIIVKNTIGQSDIASSVIGNSGTAAYGLGVDLGFIVKFNKFVRIGLSATDIGFFVFPQTATANYDFDVTLNPTRFQNFSQDFGEALQDNLARDMVRNETPTFFMPSTAVRTGIALVPVNNKNLEVTLAMDIAVTDFNKLITNEYVTFNFATGIELLPRAAWFEVPIRTAFNYNSQANVASLSFGSGFHFGPVELEYGIKGLEILISDWGAKEFSFGADMKFEF